LASLLRRVLTREARLRPQRSLKSDQLKVARSARKGHLLSHRENRIYYQDLDLLAGYLTNPRLFCTRGHWGPFVQFLDELKYRRQPIPQTDRDRLKMGPETGVFETQIHRINQSV